MEIFHRSDIPCTSSKGGDTNITNLSPLGDTSLYLYLSRLNSHTNAFCCPNQITLRPNIQGIDLILKGVPQSGSNLATNCQFSKGDAPPLY